MKRWRVGRYGREIALAAIAAALSLAAIVYSYRHDLVVANGDVIAHLGLSRRFFDSLTPGFTQLGYVWLPINHLLMLPLVWVDWLWHSGLAGSAVSAAAFVGSAVLVYKIAERLAGRRAGLVAFALFAFNPSALYLQATPLTEMFFVFNLLATVWFIMEWARTKATKPLLLAAGFLLLATLSRYDGWFLALVVIAAVAAYDYLTDRDPRQTEATTIVFSTLALFGAGLWLVWNWVIFKNPFYFAFGQYSAKSQQRSLLAQDLLPSYHDLGNALAQTAWASLLISDWVLAVTGVLGAGYVTWRIVRTRAYHLLWVLLLAFSLPYYVFNLYNGNGVIFVPNLWPHQWHNIRYGIILLPFLAVMAAAVAARYRPIALLVTALVLSEYALQLSTHRVVAVNESLYGFAGRRTYQDQIGDGRWLADHYDEGLILADVFKVEPMAFYSHIPLKRWVSSANADMYAQALKSPQTTVRWVVIRRDDEINQRFGQGPGEGFQLVYRNGAVTVYKNTGERPELTLQR